MTTARKKIAYVSGTRADFGLMTPVLKAVEKSEKLSLQVYATGMHLMPLFGETIREVKKHFPRVRRLEAVIERRGSEGQAIFAAALLPCVAAAFAKDRPDFVLLLGDRVEMFVVALACRYLSIPTGHLHGGERSGTVDDSARHAISKLASLHFAATRGSAARLRKMGEEPWRIRVVGAPALDIIRRAQLPSQEEVCDTFGLDKRASYLLVLQHSVSEEAVRAGAQMRETLRAVRSLGLPIVIVYPNADTGGREMIREIEKERQNPLAHIFPSIAHTDFLALARGALAWVGNSSGALIESPLLGVQVVNIGTRQRGRERAGNVRDAGYNWRAITAAITAAIASARFARRRLVSNPYGDGTTAQKVVRILEHLPPAPRLLAKQITY